MGKIKIQSQHCGLGLDEMRDGMMVWLSIPTADHSKMKKNFKLLLYKQIKYDKFKITSWELNPWKVS